MLPNALVAIRAPRWPIKTAWNRAAFEPRDTKRKQVVAAMIINHWYQLNFSQFALIDWEKPRTVSVGVQIRRLSVRKLSCWRSRTAEFVEYTESRLIRLVYWVWSLDCIYPVDAIRWIDSSGLLNECPLRRLKVPPHHILLFVTIAFEDLLAFILDLVDAAVWFFD